jgi:hypothetical protein
MISLTEYIPATGKITRIMSATFLESLELNKREGYAYFEGEAYSRTQYISGGEIVDRPVFVPVADKQTISADGVDVITITGLPTGSTDIKLVGPVFDQWTDTEYTVELTVNMQGSYTISFEHWPYQDAEVTFNAS